MLQILPGVQAAGVRWLDLVRFFVEWIGSIH
jgi:hypothetical protein